MTKHFGTVSANSHFREWKKGTTDVQWLIVIAVAVLCFTFVIDSRPLNYFIGRFLISAFVRFLHAETHFVRGMSKACDELEMLGFTDVEFIGDGFTAKYQGQSVVIQLTVSQNERLDVILH